MRPVRLQLHGFSAYRSETTIDFGDHDLIVFTGPTGAGKSSIIDGIVFALYGSVARYDNEKLVAPIINALSSEARVRFDFSVGGTTYTAVRIVRRTANGASTKEARLECGDEVLASTAQELTAEVERILGLSFSQFTKTVVLPQGDFARFLTERPRTRQQLLRQLLGLDVFTAIGKAARRRSRRIAAEITTYERVLQDGTPVTKTQIATMQSHLDSLDEAQENVAALGNERTTALETLSEATALLDDLDERLAAVGALKMPPEAKSYGSLVTKAESARTAARKALEKANAKHSAAVAKRAEFLDDADIDAGLELYGELAAVDEEVESLTETHAAANAHLDDAVSAAATEAVTIATQATAEYRARLEAAQDRRVALATKLDGRPTKKQLVSQQTSARTADEKLIATADEVDAATAAVDAASIALEDAAASGTAMKRQFTEARDALSALHPPAPGEDSLKDDWLALVAWGKAQSTERKAERKQLAKGVAAAEKNVASAEKRLVAVGTLFVAPGATIGPDQVAKVVSNAHADARVALANAEDRFLRQNTQSEQLVSLRQNQTIADELGKHLASGMFERWIMTDVMQDLAERAYNTTARIDVSR